MARPNVEAWEQMIDKAVDFKRRFSDSNNWPSYRDYYRGVFPGYAKDPDGEKTVLPYNLIFPFARTVIGSTYFRSPYIVVSPRDNRTSYARAKMVEGMDNWLIQEMGLKRQFKTAVLHTYLCGRTMLKVGYDSQFGYMHDEEDLLAKSLDTRKDGDELIEYRANIKKGMPWVVALDPDMFLIPPGVKDLCDCRWVDHIVLRHLADVKADSKYKNVADLTGSHYDVLRKLEAKNRIIQDMDQEDEDDALVELHELHDMKFGDVSVMVHGHDKFIRGPIEDALQIEGLPFVDMCFNEDPEYFWCSSDVKIVEPQQLELNEARTQAMYHRRLALVKLLVQKGAIDDEQKARLLDDSIAPFIEVEGSPREVVDQMQVGIPNDLIQWVNIIREDAREITGLARQELGSEGYSQDRMTATKSSIIHQGSQLRMDEKRDAVATALTQVMRKVNQICFKFWDMERVVQVVGMEGARHWVKYTGQELRGEYDIKVDADTLGPVSKEGRKQEMVALLQTLAKNPRVNVDALMRMLLQEFEWSNAMEILPMANPQGTPVSEGEFTQQQGQLAGNPQQLMQQRQQNMSAVGGMMGAR